MKQLIALSKFSLKEKRFKLFICNNWNLAINNYNLLISIIEIVISNYKKTSKNEFNEVAKINRYFLSCKHNYKTERVNSLRLFY